MQKKMIPFLFMVVLTVSLLLGCGASETSEPLPEGPVKEEPSGEEEGGKPSESEEVAPEEAPEAPEAILSLEGPGNLMSNLLNDGTAAYYDGYVYHSDKMMFGNLMKTEVATDETQLLVRGSLHDINVSGDRVFAVGYTEPKDPKDLSQYGIFMASL